MKKRKGFTLVELLVVIAIIALLMGILMPALAKVRQIAYRMVCGANMSGIGKAMLAYANENGENYPVSGLPGKTTWATQGSIPNWFELQAGRAFGRQTGSTITSCLYLLVRTQEGTTKQFVCKGDIGTKIFTLKDGVTACTVGTELQNCWDFGSKNKPGQYSSYAYNMPFYHMATEGVPPRSFPVTSSSNSGCPILADRNPYNDKNADAYIDGRLPGESPPTWEIGDPAAGIPDHYSDQYKTGNSACHQREGQNVLFNDSRVNFEKFPNVGIDNDNIWKYWSGLSNPTDQQKQLSTSKPSDTPGTNTDGSGGPRNERDAYLVAEHNRALQ